MAGRGAAVGDSLRVIPSTVGAFDFKADHFAYRDAGGFALVLGNANNQPIQAVKFGFAASHKHASEFFQLFQVRLAQRDTASVLHRETAREIFKSWQAQLVGRYDVLALPGQHPENTVYHPWALKLGHQLRVGIIDPFGQLLQRRSVLVVKHQGCFEGDFQVAFQSRGEHQNRIRIPLLSRKGSRFTSTILIQSCTTTALLTAENLHLLVNGGLPLTQKETPWK
jgi:hypothetical protein